MIPQLKGWRHTFDRGTPTLASKFFTTSKISENIHETPEGYLVCVGVPIARTGEMVYGEGETPLECGPDGRVIVSRNAKELFAPETISSFEGKAVTLSHPSDFVSPQNWSTLAKGIMQNVRRGTGEQENDLVADLLVTEATAISRVKEGLREVSCGYEALYTQVGIGRGVQTKIIGNHLALVDEGRAGAAYAINDHKGKGSRMKWADKIKAIFSKAQDEALQVVVEDDEETKETPIAPSKAALAFDELTKAAKEAGKEVIVTVRKPGKAKDMTTAATAGQPATTVAGDDETGLEARLVKLEGMVSALMEKLSTGDADKEDKPEEKTDDEDGEEDDTDDGYEEKEEKTDDADEDGDDDEVTDCMDAASDIASRVEILAPGMNPKGKNLKAKAIEKAYSTKDGKAVIDRFTGGKSPDLKNTVLIDAIFTGASEILKVTRTKDLAKTKTGDFVSQMGQPKGAMTPEQMNAKNAEHYGKKSA